MNEIKPLTGLKKDLNINPKIHEIDLVATRIRDNNFSRSDNSVNFSPELSICISFRSSGTPTALLTLSGNIVKADFKILRSAFDECISNQRDTIIVDMNKIGMISSAGWKFIISEQKRLKRKKIEMYLCSLRSELEADAVFSGIQSHSPFKIYSSIVECQKEIDSINSDKKAEIPIDKSSIFAKSKNTENENNSSELVPTSQKNIEKVIAPSLSSLPNKKSPVSEYTEEIESPGIKKVENPKKESVIPLKHNKKIVDCYCIDLDLPQKKNRAETATTSHSDTLPKKLFPVNECTEEKELPGKQENEILNKAASLLRKQTNPNNKNESIELKLPPKRNSVEAVNTPPADTVPKKTVFVNGCTEERELPGKQENEILKKAATLLQRQNNLNKKSESIVFGISPKKNSVETVNTPTADTVPKKSPVKKTVEEIKSPDRQENKIQKEIVSIFPKSENSNNKNENVKLGLHPKQKSAEKVKVPPAAPVPEKTLPTNDTVEEIKSPGEQENEFQKKAASILQKLEKIDNEGNCNEPKLQSKQNSIVQENHKSYDSVQDKINAIIAKYGPCSVVKISSYLHSAEFGNEKIGLLGLVMMLKAMNLYTRKQRIRFYRSC